MDGWIKLHRALLDKAIWLQSTCEQKTLLITLLLLADHKGNQWFWNGRKFETQPGQLITSIESLSKQTGISPKKIRTALVKFEKMDFLASKTANTGRVITIVNWGVYQGSDEEKGKQVGNQRASGGQTVGKQRATNKNVKKDKNVRSKEYIKELWLSKFQNEVSPELLEAIAAFSEMRDEIKKPLTEKAFGMFFDKLNKMAPDEETKIAIVNQSTMNNWQGIFELKGGGVNGAGKNFAGKTKIEIESERYKDYDGSNQKMPWDI